MNRLKQILVGILSLVIIFEIVFIARMDSKNAYKNTDEPEMKAVLNSQRNYKINNESIPAYTVEGSDETYFTNVDLKLFGFECKLSEIGYVLLHETEDFSLQSDAFLKLSENEKAKMSEYGFANGENEAPCYVTESEVRLVPEQVIAVMGDKYESEVTNTTYYAFGGDEERANVKKAFELEVAAAEGRPAEISEEESDGKVVEGIIKTAGKITGKGSKTVVLDPGHGKSSSLMNEDEKKSSGWVKNSRGEWGEWRHYKTGSSTVNCEASGCNGRVTPNGACWYPIGNGDRATEPDVNLQNALAAKKYLEKMGYTVRMTRTTNDENPSITKRLSYCHPNNDTSKAPDAELFLCIHSNAAGGSASGSAYISAEGAYDQKWIKGTYVEDCNRLGKLCNDSIVEKTSLSYHGNGIISFEPELIAFCKSPVTCGYLEIGFFDNSAELSKMKAESDAIGKAIAEGIDEFCSEN